MLEIEMFTDNDAFRMGDGTINFSAVGETIIEAGKRIKNGETAFFIKDINGNSVGVYTLGE